MHFIIDNCESITSVMEAVIKSNKQKVKTFKNPKEFLQFISKNEIAENSKIFTDIEFSGQIAGEEWIRILNEKINNPEIVIMLSRPYTFNDIKSNCSIIMKPFIFKRFQL